MSFLSTNSTLGPSGMGILSYKGTLTSGGAGKMGTKEEKVWAVRLSCGKGSRPRWDGCLGKA